MITLHLTRDDWFLDTARALAVLIPLALVSQACGNTAEKPAEPPPATTAAAPPPTPAPPPAPAGPDFVPITAAALMQIYQDNSQYQADELAGSYVGRMLKVNAVVQSVSNDASGVVVVTSASADDTPKGSTLRLQFPKDAEGSLAGLKRGAPIQAGCQINKIEKTKIELKECTIL